MIITREQYIPRDIDYFFLYNTYHLQDIYRIYISHISCRNYLIYIREALNLYAIAESDE